MIHGVFPYDGDSVRDRTATAGAAQCYHPIAVVAHPPIPRFPPPPPLDCDYMPDVYVDTFCSRAR